MLIITDLRDAPEHLTKLAAWHHAQIPGHRTAADCLCVRTLVVHIGEFRRKRVGDDAFHLNGFFFRQGYDFPVGPKGWRIVQKQPRYCNSGPRGAVIRAITPAR